MPLPSLPSLPSLAGLPATPPTGHAPDQARILIDIIKDITQQMEVLNARVRELEESQKALETQLRHGHGPTSPSHEPDDRGNVLWGSGGTGE